MMYRSEVMCITEDVREIINIRLNLHRHTLKKSLRKILHQNNKRFTTKIQPLALDIARDALYQQQKSKFKGFIFEKLAHFFHVFPENIQDSIFETYEVAVYDGEKLVAVSFFDVGKKSVISLLGLYDSAYSKYSLGTYTMLCEIEYGKETNRRFYYPGYIIGGDSAFDYKLKLGNFQYYDWHGTWKSLRKLPQERGNTLVYKEKMWELEILLRQAQVSFQTILYPFFSFGYLSFGVKHPSFFSFHHQKEQEIWAIASYVVEDDCYIISFIRQYMTVDLPNMTCAPEFYNTDLYCMKMLDYEEILLQTSSVTHAFSKIMEICEVGI
jgi:arginine-tRNA-protein transferase